jgi:MFS family permease
MILALLLQAITTGIFVGGVELEASAAFLETFGADRIPMALMISGVAGILIATVYSYFSKQLGVRSFGILNLVAALAITVALLIGMKFFQPDQFDFVVFVLAGPMGLITLLGFWITVREFLSPSRGRQLGGLIEATLIGGMIVAFVAIPLLVRLGMILQNVLYLTMGGLIVATGAQLYVLDRIGKQHTRFRKRVFSTGPIMLFSHKFTGLISSFAVMSVAVAVLLQYMFLSVTEIRYPGGADLVAFLGYFSAVAAALAWMVKRFLFGWIKQRFGIRTTLLLAPGLLMLLTIASAIAGERYGFSAEANFFTYFFIMVVLSKFFGKTMKDSMEDPSLNLIYKSLDPRERHYVKSGIEGVLSQIALFVSGLLLAFYVMLSFVQVYHVTYVLFLFLVIWFFIGLALYRNYHKLLKVTLESDRLKITVDKGLEEMAKADLSQTAYPVELLEFNPYFFHYTSREHMVGLLTHPHAGVRRRIWDHLLNTSPGLPELTINQLMIREKEPKIKERIRTLSKRKLRSRLGLQEAFIKERLDRFISEKQEPENVIEKAFHSGINNEVYAALYHVAEKNDHSYLPEVVSLFRNDDPTLQSVAISTAGIISSGENGGRLIGFLEDPRQYAIAWSALVRQGEKVLDDLETAFHKPGATVPLQLRIVSIISAIGGERSAQLLLDKLDYHHREVFSSVVRGLYDNQFQASEIQVALIQNAIIKMVHTGTWNMAARISVRTDDPGGSLAAAIEHEIWDVNELILMLMSLVYDRKSVQRIRLILLDRQSEEKGMAIELLDLLLREPLKSVLIAYFHDVAVREKIDKLRELYPIHIFPVDTLLKRILNRDGTQMGDFIRICVLERMGNEERFFDEQQIIAQGFHPNPRIRETAAQLLRKNDPEQYHMVTERLDFPDNSFPGHEDAARWYVETTMKLTAWKLFAKVGINALFKLVSGLVPYTEEQLSEGDYVVLARSASTEEFSPLTSGIAIIAEHQPEILEQIRYLGTIGTTEAYLVDREQFIEQLFDDRSLLHVFCDFLNQSRGGTV